MPAGHLQQQTCCGIFDTCAQISAAYCVILGALCLQLMAGIAIAAFMVPLSQIQTLDEISWLAYSGADSLPNSGRP